MTQTGIDDMEIPTWDDSPEDAAINAELGRKLKEGISRLDPDLRAVVILRDVQSLPSVEAAEVSYPDFEADLARLIRGEARVASA